MRSGIGYSADPTANRFTDFDEGTQRPHTPSDIPDPHHPSNRVMISAPSSLGSSNRHPHYPTGPPQPLPQHPSAGTNRHQQRRGTQGDNTGHNARRNLDRVAAAAAELHI